MASSSSSADDTNEGTNDVFRDRHSGHRFVMPMDNPTARAILAQGIYEWPLIQWCQQFLAPGKVFVDIGAHMGTYSIHLAPFCREVHSFEAQRSTYYNLCAGIALNNRSNIVAHHVALGNTEDDGQTLTLHKVSADGGGSTMEKAFSEKAREQKGEEKVTVHCLDHYHLRNVGFLKLDVEGWELNVLQGAVRTLEENGWPKFIFEVWPDAWYREHKEKLFTFVKGLGYKIIPISGYTNMYLAARD